MNGSLRFDLWQIKRALIVFFAANFVTCILSIFAQNPSYMMLYLLFMILIPLIIAGSRYNSGWRVYEDMLPTTSEQVVSGVYIIALINAGVFAVSSVIGNITGAVICKLADGALDLPKPDEVTILGLGFFKVLFTFLFLSLICFGASCIVLYRYSGRAGKMLTTIAAEYILVMLLFVFMVTKDTEAGHLFEIPTWLTVVSGIIAIPFFPLSYKFSEFFYDKYKD